MSTSMPDCGSKIARDQTSVHLPDFTLAGVSTMRSEAGPLPVVLISSPQMPRRSASTASICSSVLSLKIFSATTVMFLPSSSAATFPTTRCTLWSAMLKLCTCSSWQKASTENTVAFCAATAKTWLCCIMSTSALPAPDFLMVGSSSSARTRTLMYPGKMDASRNFTPKPEKSKSSCGQAIGYTIPTALWFSKRKILRTTGRCCSEYFLYKAGCTARTKTISHNRTLKIKFLPQFLRLEHQWLMHRLCTNKHRQ